jgi:hypothetical protein
VTLTGYFADADLPFLLGEDFGVLVVIGVAPAFPGIVDKVGKDVLTSSGASGVSGVDITVSVQTSVLPANLKNRATLTVDGVAMRLRDQNPQGDGAITHLLCELVK